METHEFVLLVMRAVGGEIQGKTKLQKTVYFLGVLTDRLEALGYRAHFYGPYSDDVTDAVTTLKTIGVIDQNVVGGWSVDPGGFERRRYDFRLNEQGWKLAATKTDRYPDVWQQLQTAVNTFTDAGDIDYMQMSIAAKTYFMLGQRKGQASMQELAHLAPRFGWSVTAEQVHQAAEYLSRMGLVELCSV
jgi:uncharacterized protein YwgA